MIVVASASIAMMLPSIAQLMRCEGFRQDSSRIVDDDEP
jgi:hypothetical protein